MKYPARHLPKNLESDPGKLQETWVLSKNGNKKSSYHRMTLHHYKFAFLMHLSKFLKNMLSCEEDSVAQGKNAALASDGPKSQLHHLPDLGEIT